MKEGTQSTTGEVVQQPTPEEYLRHLKPTELEAFYNVLRYKPNITLEEVNNLKYFIHPGKKLTAEQLKACKDYLSYTTIVSRRGSILGAVNFPET
jgi:hypothetical protein